MSQRKVTSLHHQELSWQLIPEDSGQIQPLPETLGSGYSKLFHLNDDISYIETQLTPIDDLMMINAISHSSPRMIVTLGLEGSSQFYTDEGGEVVFKAGYCTITSFSQSKGYRYYQGGQTVSQLRFSISKVWLEQQFDSEVLDTLFNDNVMQLIGHRPLSTVSMVAAQNLLSAPHCPKTRPLFRLGQAMSILASELCPLFSQNPPSQSVSARDRQLAEQARDILIAEFKTPPSIDELCKRLGTNAFKLKQLFHSCFNTTPYGMLLDIRMKHAYQLLKTREYSVGLVAEAVGYQHASNFSAAFIKYFGCSPKKIGQQQKFF